MKLHEWLATNGKTATWLAEETGLSVSHVSRLIERDGVAEKSPSMEACAAISVATGGDVTANDFMPEPKPRKRRIARKRQGMCAAA
jgi:DNA-binding transcriptional regulator YdaS (Cro superfamily)